VCVSVCVCERVCVYERGLLSECVCVCVCVCEQDFNAVNVASAYTRLVLGKFDGAGALQVVR